MPNLLHNLFLSPKAVRNSIKVGAVICVVESVLLLVAGIMDKSFYLKGEMLGVLEHPGPWIIILGDMLILTVVTLLIRLILKLPEKCPIKTSKSTNNYLTVCRKRIFSTLFLQTKTRNIFFYMAGCGTIFWINNAYQTLKPLKYYGNDLFDSINYIYGYYAVRAILGSSWIILIPYAAYCFFIVGFSIWRILKTLNKKKLLVFNIYHPDKCGGYSYFGDINVMYVLGILIIYCELSVILLTHKQINPGLFCGFVLATFCFTGLTFVVLWPLNNFLSQQKYLLIDKSYQSVRTEKNLRYVMEYDFILNKISFNPYPILQRVIIVSTRLFPVVVGISKIYLST